MKHFSRTLTQILAGPPRISQTDLSRKTGLVKSKLCRLLQDVIACDRDSLHAILRAIPKAQRRELLCAYLQDVATPDDLALLKNTSDPWSHLQLQALSPKGTRALKAILNSGHVHHLDRILQNLATAFGLE